MSTHRYVVNVEGAIARDGRYLMIIRGNEESHAPGVLSLPGGKVEGMGSSISVLEETLKREIREEVGLEVHDAMEYVESNSFIADDGEPVVDILFLCHYKGGTLAIASTGEVGAVQWMSAEEVLAHPKAPRWTRQSIQRAEKVRLEKDW